MTDTSLSNLAAGAAVSGTDLFYDVQVVGIGGVKVTGNQIRDYIAVNLQSAAASTLTLGGAALGGNVFAATGSGSFSGSLTVGTSFIAGSAGGFTWAGKSSITSDADGYINLTNNAGGLMTMLRFGSTTAGVPAIQVLNATTLSLRDGTTATNIALTADRITLGSIATTASSSAMGLVVGVTGNSPGWYTQLTTDTSPRVRVGLNVTDIASISFGPGDAGRDLFIERSAAASLRQGGIDTTAPVAQVSLVQNVITGTLDTAGASRTYDASQSTGTGAGGSHILRTSPAAVATGTAQNALENTLVVAAGASSFTPRGALSLSPNAPLQASASVAGNAVTIAGSAATAGSSTGAATGGAVNITGGTGARTTTTGGTGGAVNITGGQGAGVNTVAGGAINITGGLPGTVTGSVAGGVVIAGGSGSTSATNATINGGAISVAGGNGNYSNISGTVPGVGGAALYSSGLGGNNTATGGTAAISGATTVSTGTGGTASAAAGGIGGPSAATLITTGAGGSATGGSGTRNGGNSGSTTIATGAAGTGASANGTVGPVNIAPGGVTLLIANSTGLVFGAAVATTVPMLVASSAVLQARLGDNSGFAYFQSAGSSVTTIQADRSTTTLSNITGLSVNVTTAKTYSIEAFLPLTLDGVGGYNFAVAGSATATTFRGAVDFSNDSTNAFGYAGFTTTFGSQMGPGGFGGTVGHAVIHGTIVVANAGTVTVQFAQSTTSGTSSVLTGAWLRLAQMD